MAFVLAMMALDLGVFHRKAHEVRTREASLWCLFWIGLALAFDAGIFLRFGTTKGIEFLTGYLIEEALSVDNLFVFLMIFSYFSVPKTYQYRVLFWGILGAFVMRATFILGGMALIQTFHWIIYIFGGFLILTGIKILIQRGSEVHPDRNPVVRFFRRFIPVTPDYHGQRFFVRLQGRWLATPLFLVLVVVEASDVLFAVDSVPAVLAVTDDSFIAYTSNIFAILGLRSFYFLLAGAMDRFHYLKVGLGIILIFVGSKMVSEMKISPVLSLVVVVGLLAVSVIASLVRPAKPK